MQYNFRSDNESPPAAAILQALTDGQQDTAFAYGEDQWSQHLNQCFSDLFSTHCAVFPVITGTAANSIALAAGCPPWSNVFCHSSAHIYNDEGGAPEFFGHGLRLSPVAGPAGKITPENLQQALTDSAGHGVHSYQPGALSLTQSTESGTVYSAGEISALTEIAHHKQMLTHMDGARFANALATLGTDPAAITWRAGIDMLSLGATKNGALGAEALIVFNQPELAERIARIRKRAGHLLSKMRYVSIQLLAYIEDDLWLRLASHANRQAAEFAAVVEQHPNAQLEYPVQANEVFVRWSPSGFATLKLQQMHFHLWPGTDDLARFVFSHATTEQETCTLIQAINDIQ